MKTVERNLQNEDTLELLILWNEDNSNAIGLKNPSSLEELKELITEGLDPFEFISEEDLELYND